MEPDLKVSVPIRSVQNLFLHDENVKDFLPLVKSSQDFPTLEELTLSSLTDLSWVKNIQAPHLTGLTLLGLELSSWELLNLPSLNIVRSLTLRSFSSRIKHSAPVTLPRLKELALVDYHFGNFKTFSGWKTPRLKHIFMGRHIEMQSFEGIETLDHKLESMTFRNVTIESFKGLTKTKLTHLKKLELACALSDCVLQELGELNLSTLQVLNLSGVSLKKDSPKVAFFSGSVKTFSDLSWFPQLNLPQVVYLSLPDNITSAVGIEHWKLPKLKVLDIRGSQLSKQDVERLQR